MSPISESCFSKTTHISTAIKVKVAHPDGATVNFHGRKTRKEHHEASTIVRSCTNSGKVALQLQEFRAIPNQEPSKSHTQDKAQWTVWKA